MQNVCLCPRLVAPETPSLRCQCGLEERVHGEGDAQEDSLATDKLRY